jgi:hypothetical protein
VAWDCAHRLLFDIDCSTKALVDGKLCKIAFRDHNSQNMPAYFMRCAILFRATFTGQIDPEWVIIVHWINAQLPIISKYGWRNPSVESETFFGFSALLVMLELDGAPIATSSRLEISWTAEAPPPFSS